MVDTKQIRSRFAPSPTGLLHVGGARTALFTYLWVRHFNEEKGGFVLRIDDTDNVRNQDQFLVSQYEDLCWLGLVPDESPFVGGKYSPYKQSERLNIYLKVINKLLKNEKAYYCFCSPEELEEEKKVFLANSKRPNYQYSRKCLKLSPCEIRANLKEQKKHVIRLKIDREREYKFVDLVRGEVKFSGRELEDCVLYRGLNQLPLYNYATVVDDYYMKISHVVRSEEHLANTPKQLVIYEALEWAPPQFAHVSMILNKEGKKLSKREAAGGEFQYIRQLREKGYLPEAIINYLLLLGWHPGNSEELFTLEEATKLFDSKGLHRRGATYDLDKLRWYNNQYIQKMSPEDFYEHSSNFLQKKYSLTEHDQEKIKSISELFRAQLHCFEELIELTSFFFEDLNNQQIEVDERSKKNLSLIRDILSRVKGDDWEQAKLEKLFEEAMKEHSLKKKEFYHPLRLAISGKDRGPNLVAVVRLLGKQKVLERVDRYLNK